MNKNSTSATELTRNLKIAFWVVFPLMLMTLAAMHLWTMPAIRQYSLLDIFDLRTTGYSFNQARILLESLGPEGTAIYMGPQQVLDIFYPAFLTVSIILAMYILAPVHWGYRRNLLIFVPLPAMTLDYLENALIHLMLKLGPEGISEDMVAWASKSTVLKFQFYGVAVLVFALILAHWAWRKRRSNEL